MTDTTSAAPSLLPCPMCGGAAAFVKHSAGMPRTMGYDQWHGVSCRSCNACVGASDRRFRERSDALAAWNRRALQPVEPAAAQATSEEVALIEKAVNRVGIKSLLNHGAGSLVYSEGVAGVTQEDLIAYTREIAMAREADPFGDDGRLVSLAMLTPETLERFAAVVAAREREACAQVCRSEMARAIYNLDNDLGINRNFWNGGSEIAESCAASITARGNP